MLTSREMFTHVMQQMREPVFDRLEAGVVSAHDAQSAIWVAYTYTVPNRSVVYVNTTNTLWYFTWYDDKLFFVANAPNMENLLYYLATKSIVHALVADLEDTCTPSK